MKTVKEYDAALENAAQEYIARKNRTSHPAGNFDKAGRWEPDDEEHCECCNYIRTPSRAYPFSYMTHCRTLDHIAHLYKVDKSDLRKQVSAMQKTA